MTYMGWSKPGEVAQACPWAENPRTGHKRSLSAQNVSAMLKGRREPEALDLALLSMVFQVPIDFFFGEG